MLYLITGGSASGKSEYAEQIAVKLSKSGERIYLATMIPYGEDGTFRVKRHRHLREGKGFLTIEKPYNIHEILSECDNPGDMVVLLEDLSNLVANMMFDDAYNKTLDEAGIELHENGIITENICYAQAYAECLDKNNRIKADVLKQIEVLNNTFKDIVVVSNNIFDDGCDYDISTMEYISLLGMINQEISRMADCVTEVVVGIPVALKI